MEWKTVTSTIVVIAVDAQEAKAGAQKGMGRRPLSWALVQGQPV